MLAFFFRVVAVGLSHFPFYRSFLPIMVLTINIAICGALAGCDIFDRVVDFGTDRIYVCAVFGVSWIVVDETIAFQ